MSASVLPSEVLQEIFRHLSGRDVAACRRVSPRWEHAVDSAGEAFWGELCATEYNDVYEEAHRKAGLSWRELYLSLSMWPRVAEAIVKIHRIPETSNNFEILQNSILAFPTRDKIAYYNLGTFKLEYYKDINRQNFEQFKKFDLQKYAENENLIVMQLYHEKSYGTCIQGRVTTTVLCVIPKMNMKYYFFRIGEGRHKLLWKLCENQIYYYSLTHQLHRISLMERDKDITLEDDVIVDDFDGHCIDIVYTKYKQINVFTGYALYTVSDNELKQICPRTKDFNEEIKLLKKHGFTWTRPRIARHILFDFKFQITKYECQAIYATEDIVIIGSCQDRRPVINIYCNPYGPNGELQLFDSEPDKSVYLDTVHGESHVRIEKIDVVETVGGHMVVLLAFNIIYIIELSHDIDRKSDTLDEEFLNQIAEAGCPYHRTSFPRCSD